MRETSTWPEPASASTRAAMWTAMPATSAPTRSHSPVWIPARTGMPAAPERSATSSAQRTARAGPSKVARKPSPSVLTSSPPWAASAARTSA